MGHRTKAFQIKCKEPEKFQVVFLMMGTFHVILTFLAVTAARFRDAGLHDVAVQSLIVAEGSVDTMFSGSHFYNRAVRVYKILYEAFLKILLDDFEIVYISDCNDMQRYLRSVNDDDESDFVRLIASKELRDYCTNLINFEENLAQGSNLARLWLSFLEVIEILLNMIYATRSRNWNLYVESLRSTLPWLFA